MPHISIKMLRGRTDEQKKNAAESLKKALCEAIGCGESHVSVSVSDYTAQEWQEQFRIEVSENPDIVIAPDYNLSRKCPPPLSRREPFYEFQ